MTGRALKESSLSKGGCGVRERHCSSTPTPNAARRPCFPSIRGRWLPPRIDGTSHPKTPSWDEASSAPLLAVKYRRKTHRRRIMTRWLVLDMVFGSYYIYIQ